MGINTILISGAAATAYTALTGDIAGAITIYRWSNGDITIL